jgi:hypothetical protein
MSATGAYFAGLIFFSPVLLVQILLARTAARKWPRFRWLIAAGAAFPFVLEFLGLPALHVHFRLPGWCAFALGLWLYTSFLSFISYWIVRGVGRVAWRPRQHDPRRRELIRAAAWAAAAVPAVALAYGSLVERDAFGVTQITVPFPNLPPDLVGFQILQISDIHRGAFLSQSELTRVVDAARGLAADLIVHGGDFISYRGDPLEATIDELARLHNAEALGCLGNHEIYAEVEDYATRYAGARGIRILRSSSVVIQRGAAKLNVAGVDYQPFSKRRSYLTGAERLVVPGAFNLLLSHNPDVFPTAARMGFDFTLSGHTHGGQVRMEILHQDLDFARIYTPYVRGLYRTGGSAGYVTRGIGTIGVPSRLGSLPEISLIKLSRV